ncbi:MAG: peptidyl-prolyl cis-trans isomerase [Verrucomicrobiales bacterium]|nr:peptidyl-prolyl cis-trans isomerase [Verrucomicrobiales bacterium]
MAYIINGERIDDQELEEEFESIKEHYQSMGETVCCDRDDEFWQYAKNNVINRTLIEQRSNAEYGPISDEEVTARFEELKAEHGGESEFLDNTGFNAGDLPMILKKLKSSLTIDRYLDSKIEGSLGITEVEVVDYYQRHEAEFMSKEEVRVSQIFIEPSSQEAAAEAFIALRELREELLEGKDFDEAAKEHGSDENREIDLGFMKQGETMPEIEAITFSMRIGEISPVVATHYGFHLFKVTDRKLPKLIPIEELNGIEANAELEKRNRAIEDVIEEIKSESTIEEVAAETGDGDAGH